MKAQDSITGRSLSRRRLLKTLGTGIAAVGVGAPDAARAQQTGGAGRRVTGNMVLATWGGRYSKAMKDFFLTPFSQESGVTAQTVDAPGGFVPMLQAQAKASNVTWDLVDVGEADSLFLLDNGLVQPLPADVKADLVAAVGAQHVADHGISFAAFGWVIAANRKTAKRIPTTPAEFFDVQNVPGRRTMYGEDQLTAVLYALQADGVARNQLYPPDLDRAYRKLDQIKKSVAVWWRTGDQSQQVFRDQEVDMGLMWDGRAAGVINQGVDLALSFEGTPISRDLLVVPTNAPNAAAAFEFLRWYATHPVEGGKWIREMGYGVANPKAYEHVPQEIAQRSAYYPPNFAKGFLVDTRWQSQRRSELVKRWTQWLSQ
jgi:putative spermidine/putrescine transport system substrate-binding protein